MVVCDFPDASSFNNDLSYYPLLALQLIDDRGISVTQSHLKELQRPDSGMDFSKGGPFSVMDFSKLTDGPGGTSWHIGESTMTNRERLYELGGHITDVMQRFDVEFTFNGTTFVKFTSGVFTGAFLVCENNIYAATIAIEPEPQHIPGSNAATLTPPTVINRVQNGAVDTVINDLKYNHFDNAKAVVAKAIGAVSAGNLVEKIQIRPNGQSIRQAIEDVLWGIGDYNVLRVMSGMGGLAYIKSKKSWKAVLPKDAGVTALGDELSTSLEKLRKKVDRNKLKRYIQAVKPSAQDRFEMLKGLAADLVEMVAAGSIDDATPGLILPASFREGLSELKTSLFNETPTEYLILQWDAILESYRDRVGDAVDVMDRYHEGRIMQLTAIEQAEQARYQPAGTDLDNPNPIGALQGEADRLSKMAIMKGQLRHIGRSEDVDVIGRDLRYANKTGRIKFNGKKRTLTMMKIKEPGSKAVYLAFSHRFPQPFHLVNECLPSY